jgi:hypothetical protein
LTATYRQKAKTPALCSPTVILKPRNAPFRLKLKEPSFGAAFLCQNSIR